MTGKRLPAFAALAMLAVPLAAQQPVEQLTYVAIYKVKPGKGQAWEDMFKKYFAPMYAKLMAEGTVTGYGLDSDLLHQPGSANADVWYTMPNLAAYDKVRAAMDLVWSKMPAADAKARFELTDMDKHQDYLLRSSMYKSKPVAVGTKPVTMVSVTQVQPGKAQDFSKEFEKSEKPIYEKLLADGVILSYALHRELVHSQDGGMRWTVIVAPNTGSFDKVNAAFAEQNQKMTPAERSISMNQWREMTVLGAHRDFLSEASIYASK